MLEISREVVRELAKNAAMFVPAVRKWRLRRPRAVTRFTGRDEELERYAFQSLRILQDSVGSLDGKTVLEIGPGDYVTSGLALLAAGAERYTSIDRFVGDNAELAGKDWYTGIEQAWSRIHPSLPWPSWLNAADFPEGYPDRVWVLNLPIERAGDIGTFDVVCSFQVGEHVSSIDSFAEASAVMLNPGGVAVHRIDFGPHDGWLRFEDPLTFLRVPEYLWRLMGSNRGLPNRRRSHEMTAAFERAGLTVHVTSVETVEVSDRQIGVLPRRFRSVPVESLATQAAVFVLRRA